MARLRSAPRSTISEDLGSNPSRVQHANEVADREERKRLLSAILRDGKATGAEAVAAARLLEAMERTATAGEVGIPPPTSRPEQVARAVRFITAVGKHIMLEALDIVAKRGEAVRASGFRWRGFTSEEVKAWRHRVRPKEEELAGGAYKRPFKRSRRAAASEPGGLSDVPETAATVGQTENADELHGDRDPEALQGEGAAVAEAGGSLD